MTPQDPFGVYLALLPWLVLFDAASYLGIAAWCWRRERGVPRVGRLAVALCATVALVSLALSPAVLGCVSAWCALIAVGAAHKQRLVRV